MISAPRPESLIKVRYLWTYGGPAKEPLTEHRLGNRRERSRSSRANLLTNISSSSHMYLPPHHQPLSKCQKYLMSYRSIALKYPLVGFCIKHCETHVSLPISLPTSNAFSLERPIRCSVKSARAEATTVIIPVQRLAKISERNPMPCHPAIPLRLPAFPLVTSSYCCYCRDSTPEPEAAQVPRHRRLRRA